MNHSRQTTFMLCFACSSRFSHRGRRTGFIVSFLFKYKEQHQYMYNAPVRFSHIEVNVSRMEASRPEIGGPRDSRYLHPASYRLPMSSRSLSFQMEPGGFAGPVSLQDTASGSSHPQDRWGSLRICGDPRGFVLSRSTTIITSNGTSEFMPLFPHECSLVPGRIQELNRQTAFALHLLLCWTHFEAISI